jgi:hypothetical protein
MISDTMIRVEGMKALRNQLGIIEAERFVNLIQREQFNYTEWQKTLWPDKTIEELFEAAKSHSQQK